MPEARGRQQKPISPPAELFRPLRPWGFDNPRGAGLTSFTRTKNPAFDERKRSSQARHLKNHLKRSAQKADVERAVEKGNRPRDSQGGRCSIGAFRHRSTCPPIGGAPAGSRWWLNDWSAWSPNRQGGSTSADDSAPFCRAADCRSSAHDQTWRFSCRAHRAPTCGFADHPAQAGRPRGACSYHSAPPRWRRPWRACTYHSTPPRWRTGSGCTHASGGCADDCATRGFAKFAQGNRPTSGSHGADRCRHFSLPSPGACRGRGRRGIHQ